MPIKISIITATFNVANVVPALIASIKIQSDPDFEWIIADGGSVDGTLELLAEASDDMNVILDSRADFGIYDALNRAIGLSAGDFYLVMGADDVLYPDAIANFRQHAEVTKADVIAAKVVCDGRLIEVRRPWPWLYGQFAYISSHAVGSLIRRSLHDRVGLYCSKYPIAADQLFLLEAVRSGARFVSVDSIAGEFCSKGISGTDILGTLSESLRVQVKTGQNLFIQVALFVLRVIKNGNHMKM